MNIQLTISLLVSDRMETLGKCLASLSPLLRELDSELIVVFTGKKEEALTLVQQYTSHIIPFVWCNDFSKARNAGLKEAKGEWFLYLDDDEWFEDTGEIIHFFQSGEYRHYQSAFYVQRNYEDFAGKGYSDAEVGRMCRLTADTEFVHPVHECLSTFDRPCKKLSAYVHHFGYLRKKENQGEGIKAARNLPLLLKMYEEDPDSGQTCMQITQEYRSIGEYGNAAEYCRKGLALSRREPRVYTYELWMQVQLPSMIYHTEGARQALEEAERQLKHPRTLEAGTLHLCIILTELCRELGEYRKGLRYVFLYQEKLLYLQNHPEKAMLQNAADVTFDSALSKEVSLYVEGLFFAAELEDLKKIRMLLSWIPWEEQERVLPWYPRLEEWKKTYGGMRDAILKEFIRLDTKNVYVCIQKMLFAECGSVDGKMAEKMTELWEICANHCPPGFQWELIEIAVRNQFALRPLLEHMTPETWTDYVLTVVSSKRTDLLENFYRNMEPLLEGFPFYARQMEQSVLEKLLTGGVVDSSRLSDLMREYCTSVMTDAKALYREEALENPAAFALPSRCQFAQNLEQAFLYIEQERFADSLPFLKKAVHIYPQMSPAVGQMIPYLEEQIRSPRQEITDEFRLLSTQVKQVLYDLVEKRQWEEAYGVADRLLSLLPDDLDVLRLKQVILRERRSTQNGLGGKMNGAVT